LAAPAADARSSSERKGRWGRFQERAIPRPVPAAAPAYCRPWPGCCWRAIGAGFGLRRFPLVVVSHTALRLLALILGQHREGWAALARRPILARTLRAAPPPGTTVVVLDVAPATRRRRIAARIQSGTDDPFDRYMLADLDRAERIEGCLVELATHCLNATPEERLRHSVRW
jgi:hypothetical protein